MDKPLYKVLVNGKSCNGGSMEWSLPDGDTPGEWHEVAGDISLCSNGLHLTPDPAQWWQDGAECYLAEGEGDQQGDNTKIAVRRARLLRRLTTDELAAMRIVSEGIHAAKEGYWRASGSATVRASGSATVRAYDSATVIAYDSATVRAYGSATVEASGSATVEAYDSATVIAYDSATVIQSQDYSNSCTITVNHGAIWIDRRTSPPIVHGRCELANGST